MFNKTLFMNKIAHTTELQRPYALGINKENLDVLHFPYS